MSRMRRMRLVHVLLVVVSTALASGCAGGGVSHVSGLQAAVYNVKTADGRVRVDLELTNRSGGFRVIAPAGFVLSSNDPARRQAAGTSPDDGALGRFAYYDAARDQVLVFAAAAVEFAPDDVRRMNLVFDLRPDERGSAFTLRIRRIFEGSASAARRQFPDMAVPLELPGQ